MPVPNLSRDLTDKRLPLSAAKCKRCRGQLRVAFKGDLTLEYWIICDPCNVAALAPSNLHALIEDSFICP